MKTSLIRLAAACTLFSLPFATSAEQPRDQDIPRQRGYIAAPDQHQAILDCNYEMGTGVHPQLRATYRAYPWGGNTVIRAMADHTLSAHDAERINACADAKLGRTAKDQPPRRAPGGCPPYAAALYGGAGYCIGR